MYSLSIVNYYNTAPFLFGLNKSELKHQLDIQLDIPSVCAQKLKDGIVDIGLVPVVVLPQLENYYIISDYCIGANGRVDSVKLFANKPLNEITHVLLDYQSRTSVALVQVLNKHFWKLPIQFIDAQHGFETQINNTIGAVIIGDRTFGLQDYKYQYDLAEEWKKYTGLPFVFACWVSNKLLSIEFVSRFNNALAFGVKNIDKTVSEKPNNTKGFDAVDYLKNKISYNFDSEKKKALKLFLELIPNVNTK